MMVRPANDRKISGFWHHTSMLKRLLLGDPFTQPPSRMRIFV
jgi:hypothetical protein